MSRARSLARKRAVQALYSWQVSSGELSDIDESFVLENDMSKVDVPYFKELLQNIPRCIEELDQLMQPLLDRPLEELDPVEHAVLRMSLYELLHKPEIPYRVVINEGVEVVKTFGAAQSHKFINGILDKAAQQVRAVEFKAVRSEKKNSRGGKTQ